ncbi:MAG: hypothetical protein AB1567_06890 [bacterium]
MAQGRMLLKTISMSKRMALLSDDTSRLLYTWLLSHLNKEGCFYADPVIVKNIVFTRLNHPVEKIKECLDEMEDIGLIIRYKNNNEEYLYYPDFKEKQPNLREDREGTGGIPFYKVNQEIYRTTPGELQELDGNKTGELQENSPLSKDKLSKDKLNINKDNILSQIENLLNLFSSDIKELILEYIDCARLENKTKQITDQKKFRLINELYSVYRVDENKDRFKQALQITINKGLGSFPYFKKVRKNLEIRGIK